MKEFRDELNFRDLGGYRTMDGRVIKKGHFYRTAGLYLHDKDELEEVKKLKLKVILDLRTKMEYDLLPDPEIPDVKFLQYSGLVSKGAEEIDFSPNGMKQIGQGAKDQMEKLKGYYRQIAFENEAYQKLFQEIKQKNTPILFHCATGKDRTGVAAMLIMLLLGVDEETIMEDYLLSNQYFKKVIERELEKEKDVIKEHPEMEELVMMTYGVSENIGRYLLEQIHKKYPRINEYFRKEYDIDDKMMEELKDYYLEESNGI